MKNFTKCFAIIFFAFVIMNISTFAATYSKAVYTVQSGDTLWKISSAIGVMANDIKVINNKSSDTIYIGEVLKVSLDTHLYTAKSGDSIWLIAKNNNITSDYLKKVNNLTSDTIYVGQILKLMPDTFTYNILANDTLYKISLKFNTTVSEIKMLNSLSSDNVVVGQKLLIPYVLGNVLPSPTPVPSPKPTPTPTHPQPVLNWPSVTYIVQAGDTADRIAKKFGTSSTNVMKYNYMNPNDWFNEGEKIAINGYAPRDYAVMPGQDIAPAKYGKLVDWFRDGQYLIKRGDVFRITDLATGKYFNVKMLGGYNHSDVEPLTQSDTNVMKQLWPQWNWTPRPVVIWKDGMNIAASLSGMPHSFDTITTNGVSGHFDTYLENSCPHSPDTSSAYVAQHAANVLIAAGLK